ncbi:MAG: hypothetical protein AAFP18_09205 [Bacteroidota bacterium]
MMVLLIALVLVQVLPGVPLDSDEADRLFELAGTLYDEGDCAAAAATYTSLLDAGVASGALHHNLGQAHLAAGDLGRAVLHLARAEQLLPHDRAVAVHLAEARALVDAEQTTVLADPLGGTAARIADAVALGALLVLGLLLWLSALALLGWRLWRGDTLPETQKTAIRRGLVVVLPLAVLLLATAALASAERQAPRAVVLDPIPLAATLGGSTEGPAVAEGVTVRLGDARGSWQAVRLPDGTQGWLPAAALGRL